jgi:hypothetical protein
MVTLALKHSDGHARAQHSLPLPDAVIGSPLPQHVRTGVVDLERGRETEVGRDATMWLTLFLAGPLRM